MDTLKKIDESGSYFELKVKHFGIDTRHEPVVYLRADSDVSRSEGFEAMSRVNVRVREKTLVSTLAIVTEDLLAEGYAGLSSAAMRLLDAKEGDRLSLSHARAVRSLGYLRSKVYGKALHEQEYLEIIADIVGGHYSAVHLAAFITACADSRLSKSEIVYLTRAMVDVGQRLQGHGDHIVDKHCVGGLPGNRTTPIVVAIVAANGLLMPKTSSRAITSPAGTADTMETLTSVDLDLPTMKHVVDKESGCIVWGGSVNLSPADDILIRVERALDIDSEGQLIASVLSKKIAAGSTDVVIDMPVGPTAKVRSDAMAKILCELFEFVGKQLGVNVKVVRTDGRQPVGRGVGPALEALDVLSVLQGEPDAPQDLRERSLLLAGNLLETAAVAAEGEGIELAARTLDSGQAWKKFQAICDTQGGMCEPPTAHFTHDVLAEREGVVQQIDNRAIARIAKLAGAPTDKAAGLLMHVRIGTKLDKGDVLMTIHAQSPGELEYALSYVRTENPAIQIGDE